ncbi:hypothetical protein [Henriciella litoralis]|uniref:hypothetical protein n=1 Tax=Henriciella litoralis TaxID=568102 RepID=UPI0009FE7828|nr:hypothetical protein [Henriciella litoralis]
MATAGLAREAIADSPRDMRRAILERDSIAVIGNSPILSRDRCFQPDPASQAPLFAIGNDEEDPACLLARAANVATTGALEAARCQFEESLASVSVADLTADWRPEMADCGSNSDERK